MIYAHYSDVKPEDWPWPNFSPKEMACRCCGKLVVIPEFMRDLQQIRDEFERPMPVSSGYRSPEYNDRVSSTGLDGPHTTGRAVDIRIAGKDAHDLLWLCIALGMTGIGVNQKGDWSSRFLHFDNLTGDNRPRVWSY